MLLIFQRPNDGKYDHTVRIAIGNGLRPDIWKEFQQRFNIKTIAEFYGATEGNMLLMNFDGKIGASGRYTPLFKVNNWSSWTILSFQTYIVSNLRTRFFLKCI